MTLEDFKLGEKHISKKEQELSEHMMPAGQLYTGMQHTRLMDGITEFRKKVKSAEVELWILSAGYGLIPEEKVIAPYEVTFQGMKVKELRQWADSLDIPSKIRTVLAQSFDLGVILLGDDYLRTCDLDTEVKLGGPAIAFCGAKSKKTYTTIEGIKPVLLKNADAKRFSCGLVGLKGEITTRLLNKIVTEEIRKFSKLFDSKIDLLSQLDQYGKKVETKKAILPVKEKQLFASFVPRRNAKMLYFIPEWDDRVDHHYDFTEKDFFAEGVSQKRDYDTYAHDVYAHEIYKTPNYDGILVSKSVIEDNIKKKNRIEAIGIHKHIRVPRNFPVMGDCGAFSYIDQDVPPYKTEETVKFYQELDFDFGVSIDHLIVPDILYKDVYSVIHPDGKEEQITKKQFTEKKKNGLKVVKTRPKMRKFFGEEPVLYKGEVKDLTVAKKRWEITLENSKDFLNVHKKLNCSFVPIAGCQGWDVESQTEMFKLQQEMGYDYIALGGLVRSQTPVILEVLEAVNKVRKSGTRIHLFGVARPEAIQDFLHAGVNSLDSARYLRQAWLSATSNYYNEPPKLYAERLRSLPHHSTKEIKKTEYQPERYIAIRVPPTIREGGKSLTQKAKALVNNGYDLKDLQTQEQHTLEAVHKFSRSKMPLEETLLIIMEYDLLMGGDKRNEPRYRQLLEDKPWEKCKCAVCIESGVDTVIFRRNNRNRRRGFHNTWWFFEFLKKMTEL
ncbi:tRNA-guanine transglycosylase DpdA [Thermodesulfobacteriota bacterium]